MLLSELNVGECAILLALPCLHLPKPLRPGGRVSMVMRREGLALVETACGTGLALCGELARQIVVVRAPT